MLEIEKLGLLLNGALQALGKKLDLLSSDLKSQKPPVINVQPPEVRIDNVNIPEIKLPDYPQFPAFPDIPAPIVNVPEAKPPIVNVPAPIVNVPPANITVEPAKVEFPKEMEVKGMKELVANSYKEDLPKNIFDEVSSKRPLPIIVMGRNGKQITEFGGSGDGGAPAVVGLKNTGTTQINPATEDTLAKIPGLSIPIHDQIVLSYTGDNLTGVVYKLATVTKATLTLSYTGAKLVGVIKT